MAPQYVAPVAPAPQPTTSSPAAAQRPTARPKSAPKPAVVRRLPTRDPPIVRVDDTLRVLGVAELVRSPEPSEDVLSASTAIFAVWFGLGAAMLLLAGATPLLTATTAFGERFRFRRGQIAMAGTYMIVGPAVGYLVVLATS